MINVTFSNNGNTVSKVVDESIIVGEFVEDQGVSVGEELHVKVNARSVRYDDVFETTFEDLGYSDGDSCRVSVCVKYDNAR